MLSNFKKGVPILESELINRGSSKQDIDKLVESGELRKYELIDGVYYINNPIESFGIVFDTTLSIDEVIAKLYVGDDLSLGMYYNLTLLNNCGACTQVPYVVEIISLGVDKKTELCFGNRKFVIYPYRQIYNSTEIDKYLVMFDVIFNKYEKYLDEDPKFILQTILSNSNLSSKDLSQYRGISDCFDSIIEEVL